MSSNTLHAEASANVGASAADAYRMIADYRVGHTRIIPPRYFRDLRVEEGGYGAGTLIMTDLPTRSGVLGFIERAVIRRLLERVYAAELALLDTELRIDARGLRVLPGRRQPEGRKKPRSG